MSHPVYKLAIIGFGTVGEGVYQTLLKKSEKIAAILGRPITIPFVLVKDQLRMRNVSSITKITHSFSDILDESNLDVVVEATPDASTAYPYVTKLLEKSISVISANKELIAKHGEELHKLAKENDCQLLYEAAVAGGIPLLNTLRHTLKTNSIQKLEGILNGTSNFILTKMREEASSFEVALAEAQENGYAEAIPDKDVDGWDAYYKTCILSQWIFGCSPVWNSEKPVGIREVDAIDISLAENLKARIKHVASLQKVENCVRASIQPTLVFEGHPLYSVEDVNNGIYIEGSIVGPVTLQGPGAGKYPTSSAVVEDVVNFLSERNEPSLPKGIQFLKDGFEDSDSSFQEKPNLFFLTAPNGLSNHLTTMGFDVIKSVVQLGKKYGALVTSGSTKLERIKTLCNELEIQVYPVLLGKNDSVEKYYFKEKAI
ncbi:homoserine dehydrogenase [Evansella sp. AB-rgal1]|uniref:homoserine dehydrogenase n=1 Tax=Evansella sp. AB-rgal1 TaxID=3242696 RepID=UPI00359D01F8